MNSRTGAPTAPLVMSRPDAPVEKSPLIGLTPRVEALHALDRARRRRRRRSARPASRVPGTQLQRQAADAGRALEAAADGIAGRGGADPAGRVRRCARTAAARRRRSARCGARRAPRRRRRWPCRPAGWSGSSTSVTSGVGHLSPRRSLNRLRPLTTASPLSVLRDDAEELRGDVRVEHDGEPPASTASWRRAGAWPDRRPRAAALARSSSSGDRPTEKPKPVWVSSPSSASVLTTHVAAVLAAACGGCRWWSPPPTRPTRRRSSHRRRGRAGRRRASAARAPWRASILRVGGEAGQVVVPQRPARSRRRRRARPAPAHSSAVPNCDVVAGLGEHLGDGRRRRACRRRRSRCGRRG